MINRKRIRFVSTIVCLILIAPFLIAWGVFGHERINRAAVLSLPAPLQTFFYNHIDFVTLESTVPDVRKYALNDKSENPRHFIDLENFGSKDSLPQTIAEAKSKYDEKFLSQNGILPWYLESMMEKLTTAMKEKRKVEILFLAADLGHYLADAHMPLHTSSNYDGQATNQRGIHSFWESRLPELFGNSYTHKTADIKFIPNVRTEIWNIIFSSHKLIDSLLLADRVLKQSLALNEIYELNDSSKVVKNKFNQPIHQKSYAKKYHDALHGMVEAQMTQAIYETSCFWFTAWVNAGKPDLSLLDSPGLTNKNAKNLQNELKLWKDGKLIPDESQKEY